VKAACTTYSDQELVKTVCDGNLEAYAQIVRRYESKLLRYANSIVKNPEDAQDCVQESFISAYKNLRSFDLAKPFSSWIYRIVHNQAISKWRKKKEVSMEILGDTIESTENLEESFEQKTTIKQVRDCIQHLPVVYAEVVYLHNIEGYSYEEVSAIVQKPKGTVSVLIMRAKKMLRVLCEKEKHEPNSKR